MNKLIMLIVLIGSLLLSCKEVIEKDISKQKVTIQAPADKLSTPNSTITFWWNEVKYALKYNVQVVGPSFAKMQKLWADTNVTGLKLQLALTPGVYEWRIRAYNGSSTTDYITQTFTIDSTLNIVNQTIALLTPADSLITNSLIQTFTWATLYNADEYRFRVSTNANTTVEDLITSNLTSSYTFTSGGYYSWSVRGQNATSNTAYTTRVLFIDIDKPNAPILKTPLNNDTITTDSISFTWTRATDSGSPLYDSLYVFRDVALMQKVLAKKLTTTAYNDSLIAGTYYWHVKSCDKAGNIGAASTTYKFINN